MYSQKALLLYAAKKEGIIKSNYQFWKEFYDLNKLKSLDYDIKKYEKEVVDENLSLICAYDKNFPLLSDGIKLSDKPYLFAYKGDIGLLFDTTSNVAVIGVLTPTADIATRECNIVKKLVEHNRVIVSGLANGCDTIAHEECLKYGGKTIAFLPTTLNNIYPKQNKVLAERIVQAGGLVITEYIDECKSKYDNIKRFIERDRLQAMFADNIILIASYMKGNGDSGSRHAMEKSREYNKQQFVLYNEETDKDRPIFALNRQLIECGETVLTNRTLGEICKE
jgi:DNA processing protein